MAADPLPYCLFLLKSRLRSEYELDQALRRKGFEEEDRQRVLSLLKEQGLVDDFRFARSWVRNRDSLAPRGEPVLRQELVKKGIAKDTIQSVLRERREEAEADEGVQAREVELARQFIGGKLRQYAHLAPDVRERRLMGLMLRRGFSYATVRRILDEV